ncbi:MAG: hypothetical protein HZY76_22970 [Anaerolineae bacterium]|nr:MAG: hypothetical protein HZY76_22970 [Anaerolineae bacterium]
MLYLFFWRKLLRVREFYADARVAEKFGSQRAVHDAMQLYSTVQTVLRPQPRSWSGRRVHGIRGGVWGGCASRLR